MYPVSSSTAMNRKSIAICGKKASTLPTPASTPSVSRSRSTPGGMAELSAPWAQLTPDSMTLISGSAAMKMAQKSSPIMGAKMNMPRTG